MLRRYLGIMAVLGIMFIGGVVNVAPVVAQSQGEVPGASLGIKSDTDLWRYVRTGNAGTSQMKNELAAVMIQSEGDNWRAFRNGPLSVYGAYVLAGIIGLLVVFYLVRGRIRIDSGPSDDRNPTVWPDLIGLLMVDGWVFCGSSHHWIKPFVWSLCTDTNFW